MTKNKIRWGILGLGNIAHQFVKDLALIADAELYAVASRSLDKAEVFAREHKAQKSYGTYEELLKDADVDIVYIATPHNSHASIGVQAMQHKKAVLCEKPVAVNSKELNEMIRAAEENEVFFMEAFWSRFNPTMLKIKQLIDAGEIGEVKNIDASFSFKVDAPEESRMFNKELIGGSLLDMGVYTVFLSYFILGKPKRISAQANFNKTGIDLQTSMIFEYENALSILYSSFVSNSDMIAKINGSEGEIRINRIWHEAQGFKVVKDEEQTVYDLPTIGKGFSYEIEECHSCLRAKQQQSALWSWEHSRDLLGIVDEVREKIGLKYPSEV